MCWGQLVVTCEMIRIRIRYLIITETLNNPGNQENYGLTKLLADQILSWYYDI